jgi:hypothetical protein
VASEVDVLSYLTTPIIHQQNMSIRYIGQKLAQHIDEELMSAAGAFSLDQVGSAKNQET